MNFNELSTDQGTACQKSMKWQSKKSLKLNIVPILQFICSELETLPIIWTLAKITWFFDVWHRNCRWLYEWNKVWKIFIGWSIKVNSCVEICKSYHVKIGKPCLTSLMWLHHQWVEIFGFWSFRLRFWKSSLLLCQYSVHINQSKFQNTSFLFPFIFG